MLALAYLLSGGLSFILPTTQLRAVQAWSKLEWSTIEDTVVQIGLAAF